MLRRVVRWIVVGVALALALHLYMQSGHSHQAHGPLTPLGTATHEGAAAAQAHGMGGELDGVVGAVDMLATCLAVLSTLLLGTLLRRKIRSASPPSQMAAPTPHRRRGPPHARLPVELCVSRR